MDNRKVTCLVMPDILTAFDAVNHDTHLEHAHTHFGIEGIVFSWLNGYLTWCTQKVVIQDEEKGQMMISQETFLHQGVPQGSALGTILHSIYISS